VPSPHPRREPSVGEGVESRLLDERLDRSALALRFVSALVQRRSSCALPSPERRQGVLDELALQLRSIELEPEELRLVARVDQPVEFERRATLEPGGDPTAARHPLRIVLRGRYAAVLGGLACDSELELGHQPREPRARRGVVDGRRQLAEALGASNRRGELPTQIGADVEFLTEVPVAVRRRLQRRRLGPQQRVERAGDQEEPGDVDAAALLEARRDRGRHGEPRRPRPVLFPLEDGVLEPLVLLREGWLCEEDHGDEAGEERGDCLHPRSSELGPQSCEPACDP
jgi:hypothetical protein